MPKEHTGTGNLTESGKIIIAVIITFILTLIISAIIRSITNALKKKGLDTEEKLTKYKELQARYEDLQTRAKKAIF